MQVSSLLFQRQVLLTLSYSHVFSKPLKSDEVWMRLLSRKIPHSTATLEQVIKALNELKATKHVVKHGEYWQINHTAKDLSIVRKKRERLSALKLQELQPFIQFCSSIKWIRGVAVTGSVSVENADAKDDVDLMIVVQSRRLWLVRPLLVFFSFLLGKRRSWNKEEYNSWCLNLWLEEDYLSVLPQKRSVYTAYEVCQASWVVNTKNTEHHFLEANSWVRQFLPAFWEQRIKQQKSKHVQTQTSIIEGLLSGCNTLAYCIQRIYMQRHMTTEKVSLTFALFHPRDTKKTIMEQWKKIIQSVT